MINPTVLYEQKPFTGARTEGDLKITRDYNVDYIDVI